MLITIISQRNQTINMDQNQPVITTHSEMRPFKPIEESLHFLRGPLEWMINRAKNVSVSNIFDLRKHVNAKRGNGSKEIAGRWQNTSLCQINVSWVLYLMFWKEKHCLVKQFASLKNVSYWYLNFVVRVTYFFSTSCWLALNQLSWNVLLFSCKLYAPIGQFCLSGPGYSSRTVTRNIP